MGEERVQAIIENEQEWRRYVIHKVDKLSDDMTGLKVKVAMVSAMCGVISSAITSVFISFFRH